MGSPQQKSLRRQLRVWAFGVLALAAVVLVVTRIGELQHFVALARNATPLWLLAGLALQALTYAAAAAVWHVALRRAGVRRSFLSLLPLGLAKLFADQVVPSGGLSGVLLVMRAMARRQVPRPSVLAILLVGLISYYAAYVLAALAAVAMLGFFRAVGPAIIAFRCWGAGVQRAGPALAGFFSNLTPLFAAIMSSAFLGEMPHLYHVAAFGLIIGGIVFSSRD